MKKKPKKQIAIIRALDVRLSQAEHAASFRKIKPVFVSNYEKTIDRYLAKQKIKHSFLKLTPSFFIDPVTLLTGRKTHQSWLYFERDQLEKVLSKIDLYQIQEPFFLYSGQVAQVAKKFDRPLISAPWMCFDHPSTYVPPYSFSVKKAIEGTDLFMMRTTRVNNYLNHFRIPDRKKVLIYHGVNTKRFYPPKKEKEDDKIRILFVGVLHVSKGLDDILDVFPKLIKKSGKNIELVICGRGPLVGKVVGMAKDLPIRYMGNVSNLKLPDVYRNSDIFCGPSKDSYMFGVKSWEEGFGFVFAEAMASGLPIVTNNCGAIKEVVGDDNYVCEQYDRKALEDSLLEIIKDDKMSRNIGEKNRKRVIELYDLEKQIKKEEKVIFDRFL